MNFTDEFITTFNKLYNKFQITSTNFTEDIPTLCQNEGRPTGAVHVLRHDVLEMFLNLYNLYVTLWVLNLFNIVLNLIVVISSGLLLKHDTNRCTYMFMGNIALADFAIGIMVIVGGLLDPTYENRKDNSVCLIFLGVIGTVTLASVFGVLLIAVDRFIYIVHSIKYKTIMYASRARLLVLAAWILAFIIIVPALFFTRMCNRGEPICAFITVTPPVYIIVMNGVVLLLILIVAIIYSIILYVAIKKIIQTKRMMKINSGVNTNVEVNTGLRYFKGGTIKMTSSSTATIDTCSTTNNNSADENPQPERFMVRFKRLIGIKSIPQDIHTPKKLKAVKIVVITAGAFAVTWTPHAICTLIITSCLHEAGGPTCDQSLYIALGPTAGLGYLNSLLNPFIYAWFHAGFRSYLKKLIREIYKKIINKNVPVES